MRCACGRGDAAGDKYNTREAADCLGTSHFGASAAAVAAATAAAAPSEDAAVAVEPAVAAEPNASAAGLAAVAAGAVFVY